MLLTWRGDFFPNLANRLGFGDPCDNLAPIMHMNEHRWHMRQLFRTSAQFVQPSSSIFWGERTLQLTHYLRWWEKSVHSCMLFHLMKRIVSWRIVWSCPFESNLRECNVYLCMYNSSFCLNPITRYLHGPSGFWVRKYWFMAYFVLFVQTHTTYQYTTISTN